MCMMSKKVMENMVLTHNIHRQARIDPREYREYPRIGSSLTVYIGVPQCRVRLSQTSDEKNIKNGP